jgi:DDE superfamily endonuclease
MAPLRGWGPSGQRLEASAPFGHWKTMTFIAALRHDRISAPWVIDGPINGELFTLYVEKVLAPTLAKVEVVILDNLASHKGKPARNAIRAKGAHLIWMARSSCTTCSDVISVRFLVNIARRAASRHPAVRKRLDHLYGRFLPSLNSTPLSLARCPQPRVAGFRDALFVSDGSAPPRRGR